MDQDQLTAAVVAGIVIVTSCVGMTLSLFVCGCNRLFGCGCNRLFGCGCNRLRLNQYNDVSESEDPNLIHLRSSQKSTP